MHNDYLVILGLQNGASEREIKKAYRELAMKYHPDVNSADGSRDKFLQVTEAYKFLMMAGPRPNQEDIRYNYNPYEHQYSNWREQARRYARQKTAEAEQLQKTILQKIYFWFNYINIAILAVNLLIIVDNFLPSVSHLQRVLTVSEIYYRPSPTADEVHMYDKIIFEDFQLRVDRKEGAGIGDTRALIYTSPILGFIHYGEIQVNDEVRRLNPSYGIYTIFKIMVPIVLIFGIAFFFMANTHINKITVVVVVTVVFLIEFIMLLAFEY